MTTTTTTTAAFSLSFLKRQKERRRVNVRGRRGGGKVVLNSITPSTTETTNQSGDEPTSRVNTTNTKNNIQLSVDERSLDYRAPGFTVGENVSTSKRVLPKRIILIRHGESQGNIDETAYQNTPDWQILVNRERERTSRANREDVERNVGAR